MSRPDISAMMHSVYADREKQAEPREYLGGSLIGHECERKLWYGFRDGAPIDQFNGRTLRLFDHGHMEEARIIRDLRDAGLKVFDVKPDGSQYGWRAVDGWFRGHIDGVVVIDEEKFLLECKTHNEKSFDALKSQGVAKSKPEHYYQMQVYMHMMKLEAGLYIAVCKNNDDIHHEYVDYDATLAQRLVDKAERIIGYKHDAPASPSYKCGFCDFRNICSAHNKPRDEAKPAVDVERVTCRSCVWAQLDKDAWHCHKHKRPLSREAQLEACDDHCFLPDFVSFAKPTDIDYAKGVITYEREDGTTFKNGPAEDAFASKALAFYTASNIGDQNAEMLLAETFGAKAYRRERRAGESLDQVAPF